MSELEKCKEAWEEFFKANNLAPDAIVYADGSPIWGWCLHHEALLEPLLEPVWNRIKYVENSKSSEELETRFLNMRPVKNPSLLPEYLVKARAVYNKTWDEVEKAWAEYYKAGAEYNKAEAEWYKAKTEYIKARSEYYKARAEYSKSGAEYIKSGAEYIKAWAEFNKAEAEYKKAEAEYSKSESAQVLHSKDVPNHTWNGKSVL